jgi:RHS repeat-associated protein
MTKMPHLQELKWDYAGNLKEVVLDASGNTAHYVYDAQGNRTRKVVVKGNITEDRIYVGDYEIYRKTTNGTLNIERETLHITDDKQKVALIETDNQNNTTVRYQYTNHLESASLELDENAAIISYEEYHPFGTTSYRSGRNETEVSLKRYKYVHKELDNETGLYYYGMRYYAAWIGRFVSVDPLQFDYPELTPFQYASNRPISGIDLDGLEYIYYELKFYEGEEGPKKRTKWFNDEDTTAYGKEGRGIRYILYQYDKEGKEVFSKTWFFEREGIKNWGLYYGDAHVHNYDKWGKKIPDSYDFYMSPIDETDKAGRIHDANFDILGVKGKAPMVLDWSSSKADITFIENCDIASKNSNSFLNTRFAAWRGETGFGIYVHSKIDLISKWYFNQLNPDEEYNSKVHKDEYYNLFLKEYMYETEHQGEKVWMRKNENELWQTIPMEYDGKMEQIWFPKDYTPN